MGCAFIVKLSTCGTQLLYATYLGGTSGDMVSSIAVDPNGQAYVAGHTNSPDFPMDITVGGPPAPGYQKTHPGDVSSFVVKIAIQDPSPSDPPLPPKERHSTTIIHLQIGNAIALIEKEGRMEQIRIDVPPQIIQERTMVPLRFIAEAFGSEVEWIASTKIIRIVHHDSIIVMQIGSLIVYINERPQRIDVPPTIRNDRTLVPLRFIAEAFVSEVEWFPASKEIKITYLQK